MQKVTVQGQPLLSTFFRVELGSKNIIPRQRRCEAPTVVSFADSVARIRRLGVETVHKIEIGAVRNTLPKRVRPGGGLCAALKNLVPAHLRHFEAAAIGLQAARQVKFKDFASKQPQRRGAPDRSLLAVFEQHLHAHANTEKGFMGRSVQHRLSQAGRVKLVHAVAHSPLPRQHHAVGVQHILNLGGDDHLKPVPRATWVSAWDTERKLPMP